MLASRTVRTFLGRAQCQYTLRNSLRPSTTRDYSQDKELFKGSAETVDIELTLPHGNGDGCISKEELRKGLQLKLRHLDGTAKPTYTQREKEDESLSSSVREVFLLGMGVVLSATLIMSMGGLTTRYA